MTFPFRPFLSPRRKAALLGVALVLLGSGSAAASTLRIGLQDDPDALDPHLSRSYVGRIVFASMCDKLVDVDPALKFVPQLATEWSWSDNGKTLTMKLRRGVKFHDGTSFDAAAVKATIERAKTMPDSARKNELSMVESVSVIDPLTVAFRLKRPDATLLAQLSDRAGMMVSPAAAAKPDFVTHPVCAGPYQFVERVQQGRIVLKKFADYWDKDAYTFDQVEFLPIPDTTVRLANLKSGGLDLIERVATSDIKSIRDSRDLQLVTSPGLGYESIEINIGNGDRAKTPFGQNKLLRQAFSLAIDRDAINQAVYDGVFTPGNQPVPPTSPYYVRDFPLQGRDVEKAKQLVKQAGGGPIPIELLTPNNPVLMQVAQVIQAMAGEAGFTVSLKASEFATLLSDNQKGNFQATIFAWSGRPDPDGDTSPFLACGAGLNDPHYCNADVDKALADARSTSVPDERKAFYAAAAAHYMDDLPILYLYHETRLFAVSKKLSGFTAHPDGLIRLRGVSLSN
jgi:peptide/nickel transport system substrate-binding protein